MQLHGRQENKERGRSRDSKSLFCCLETDTTTFHQAGMQPYPLQCKGRLFLCCFVCVSNWLNTHGQTYVTSPYALIYIHIYYREASTPKQKGERRKRHNLRNREVSTHRDTDTFHRRAACEAKQSLQNASVRATRPAEWHENRAESKRERQERKRERRRGGKRGKERERGRTDTVVSPEGIGL